jgi:hypothetical protein
MVDREDKIRKRAYHLWIDEGMPEGRESAHWELASELVAIEENADTMLLPNPLKPGEETAPDEVAEEAFLMENLGEFPTLTDQGEEETSPEAPRRRAAAAKPAAPKSPAAKKAAAKPAVTEDGKAAAKVAPRARKPAAPSA